MESLRALAIEESERPPNQPTATGLDARLGISMRDSGGVCSCTRELENITSDGSYFQRLVLRMAGELCAPDRVTFGTKYVWGILYGRCRCFWARSETMLTMNSLRACGPGNV